MRAVAAICAALAALAATAAAATDATGRPVARPVAVAPPSPPPAATLGPGTRPDVIVDAAGTAHIAWSDARDGEPTRTVYCRLPRGARACQARHELVPPGADRYSVDLAGPAVAAVNDQVVVMSARYPQTVTRPDGTTAANAVHLWTSDDGGDTFTTPAVVASGNGPGTAVAGDVRGGAVAFGPPEAPVVAVATGVVTGGVTVTSIRPGAYAPLGASVALGDLVDARLAVHDGRPIVVYRDLQGRGLMRRWSGQGDPNDAATWTAEEALPGHNPEVTVAGGRLLVAVTDGLSGTRLLLAEPGRPGGTVLARGWGIGGHAVAGLPDGRAVVTWQGSDPRGATGTWMQVVAAGGRPQGAPALVGPPSAFGRTAAAADGGGVTVAEATGGAPRIVASAFGTRAPTGLLGLGSRPGGGALPPDAAVDCQRIRFGAVEALLQDGCYLNAARGRAKVSTGPLRLNGIDIVPEPDVQVIVDARARTIRTTGPVRALLRARGAPEILLYRGPLALRLAAAAAGRELLSFPRGVFRPNILGFPVAGEVDITLAPAGVRIPVSLTLPAGFGGITGSAVLVADNARGLHLDSLEFRADGVPLGPAVMRRLHVQYRASGGTSVGDCLRPPTSGAAAGPNEWAGVFELQLPPPGTGPALCGSAVFASGALRGATFNIDLPPPGIVLFPGVSITALGGGLLMPPRARVDAAVRIAAIQAAAGSGLVNIDGRLSFRLGAPFMISGTGRTSVAGVTLGSGGFDIASDGYAGIRLTSGPEIGPIRVQTSIAGFVDAPRRAFSLGGRGDICVGPACAPSAGAVVSTRGVAVCLPAPSAPRGAGYRWGEPVIGGVDVWLASCDMEDYAVGDLRQAARTAHQAGAREAHATIAGRPASASLRVRGDGGVPDVEVIGPDGAPAAPEAAYGDGPSATLYLSLRRPAPGAYLLRARDGSPAIAEVAVSRQVTPASVASARVTGRGRGPRVLAYRARIGAGQSIAFAERGSGGTRLIGAARPGTRRLRFTPAPGPGGTRHVIALIAQGGLVRHERAIARFRVPAPPPVARAGRLRLRRAGGRVLATWRPPPGLAAQRVTVRVSDGRTTLRTLGARTRRTAVPVERGDIVRIAVAGQARDGRIGRPAAAVLRAR